MARTRLVIECFLPTTAITRVADAVGEVAKALNSHRAENVFVTYSGPHFNSVTENDYAAGKQDDTERLGRRRDADEDEGSDRSARKRSASDDADADADAKPVKRGRGRPRKAEGSGKATEGRKRVEHDEDDDAEASRGNEPVRTRKGADEGADGSEARERGTGRGRDDQRGNREASRISTGEDRGEADDDEIPEFLKKDHRKSSSSDRRAAEGKEIDSDNDGWGDEDDEADDWAEDDEDPRLEAARAKGSWPDELLPVKPGKIDKTVISTLLGEHFKAAGGKDRQITFDVMENATGQRALKDVDENDYVKLAKALMKDAAKYEFGLQK